MQNVSWHFEGCDRTAGLCSVSEPANRVSRDHLDSLDMSQMTATGPPDETLQPDTRMLGSTGENARDASHL